MRKEYDAVFVHMNPEYVILGGLFWRRWRKVVALWYMHKSVTWRLRAAERMVNIIFTASKESFRLPSAKLRIVGHGIDTELFKPDMKEKSIKMRIITAGRVTPSKHLIEMLSVLDELHARGEKFSFTIIGAPAAQGDAAYEKLLQSRIKEQPYSEQVRVLGPLPSHELPALLNGSDIFLNFSTTGSMDKAVLEALACGTPVVTTNEAFRDMLLPYGLYVAERNSKSLASAVSGIMNRADRAGIVATLRNKVVAEHSLSRLIPKLLDAMSKV